jgi:hypothetical protein
MNEEREHEQTPFRSPLRIDANGVWFYNGEELQRPELVRLFYSILQTIASNGGKKRYALVTPVEVLPLEVDDVPFAVIAADKDDEGNIWLTLNEGSRIPLDASCALRLSESSVLYLETSRQPHKSPLEARFTLKAYWQFSQFLTEIADNQYEARSFGVSLTVRRA